jgi:putative DNA primase/helicase
MAAQNEDVKDEVYDSIDEDVEGVDGVDSDAGPAGPPPPNSQSANEQFVESADDPYRIAKVIAGWKDRYIKHRGEYFEYSGKHWEHLPTFANERLYTLVRILVEHGTEKGKLPHVTRRLIGDVDAALTSMITTGRLDEPPFFTMPNPDDPDHRFMMPLDNGILDVTNGRPKLLRHTPRLFSTSCLPFGYDPHAHAPMFEKFLRDQWGDDLETIETIDEILGYLLTHDTAQHRIFVIIGPPRSGKSVFRRILEALVGPGAVVATSPAAMGDRFGLQPLLNKSVAIMAFP